MSDKVSIQDNLLLAEQYEATGEHLLAAEYLYQAGEKAATEGAYDEAGDYLKRGLTLVERQGEATARCLQTALHYRLGALYIHLGRWAKGAEHLEDSLNIARELGDNQQSVEALVGLGQSGFKQGQLEAAETYLQEALALAHEIDDKPNAAFALMWLGAIPALRQQFDQAESYLRQALALARELDAQALAARTLNILGESARLQGKNAEAVAHYEEALSIYRGVNNQFGVTMVIHNLGHVAVASGDVEAALEHYYDALRLAVEIQAIPPALETLAGLAGIKVTKGETEESLELLGLVLHHPACPEEARRMFVEPTLAQLRADLTPEVVLVGLERGRNLDFDTVVHELLTGSSNTRVSS